LIFNRIKAELKRIDRKKNFLEYREKLKENSKKIRERLLKYIMIRRTRSEIMQYFPDNIKTRSITFPEVKTPIKCLYQFDQKINSLFDNTISQIKQLKYARYKPAHYLSSGASQFEKAQQK
jgi:hypothetical protein